VNSVSDTPKQPGHGGSVTAVGSAGLVFDGVRLQCAECGGWYRHLATHAFMAHGLLAEDYRAEHGLSASVPLVVDEISEALRANATARGTEHLDRWRRPGPEREQLVDKLRETKREQADEYWTQKLTAAGWRSWFDATAWAQTTGAGWAGIAERLGVTWQSARTAGLRAGAQLRHRSWRVFELAEAYVHEHGNLDYADGELGQYLANARAYIRNTGRQTEMATALDSLDPNWRLTAAQRIERSIAAGTVFEHPTARRHRLLWEQRLAGVGWVSWTDAVLWAARTGGGPTQIAEHLGTEAPLVSKALQQHWHHFTETGADPHAAAGPYILDPAAGCGGALTSDDHSADGSAGSAVVRTSAEQERIQCLVCGLWLGSLGQHLPIHHLTSTDYKTRFTLPGRARMSGYRPRRAAPPAHSPQYWDPILTAHNFDDLQAAVAWAIDQDMAAPELARHLSVRYNRLNRALKAAGLRFPTVGDRMILEAKAHIAAGGNLSEAPTAEMRAWLDTVRSTLRVGRRSVFAPQLDRIDPQWQLTAHQRTAATGAAYVHKGTRAMRSEHARGLGRAGWESIEQAVAWAHAHQAPAAAIGIATGIPVPRVAAQLKRLGHQLPTPPKTGIAFRTQLTAIADHLHQHRTLDGLPEPLMQWLRGRQQLETTGELLPDPWINALLDHLYPDWRTPTDLSSDEPETADPAPRGPTTTATSTPTLYTIDSTWHTRLTRVGWSNWSEATDWAAERQAGIGAIAHHLDVRQGDILDQLQKWWNAHPDTLHTITPPDDGPLVLPGRGTHTPCPACRLWFPDTAAHHKAAHTRLPPAEADNPPPATTSGKPRPRPRNTPPTPVRKPKKKLKPVTEPAPAVEDPWASRLAEHGFTDYHAAARWAATARPDDPLTALAHKLQTPKSVLTTALETHGIDAAITAEATSFHCSLAAPPEKYF
jgi:predicted transcriptional regulator